MKDGYSISLMAGAQTLNLTERGFADAPPYKFSSEQDALGALDCVDADFLVYDGLKMKGHVRASVRKHMGETYRVIKSKDIVVTGQRPAFRSK